MKTSKTSHPLYQTWIMMKVRCHNPKHSAYKNYGGRGINVCESWITDFWQFVEDMGDKPKGSTLDRIDNDKDYSPENCRWATKTMQAQNVRCKGYHWCSTYNKWRVMIGINYKRIHIGRFDTEEEARDAYLKAKELYHVDTQE